MRMSHLFGTTLRDEPSGVSHPGQALLMRAGFLRELASGSFAYLPLGVRVLARIESLLRGALDDLGAQELALPASGGPDEDTLAVLCRSEVRSWRQLPRLLVVPAGWPAPTRIFAVESDNDGLRERARTLLGVFRSVLADCGVPVGEAESEIGQDGTVSARLLVHDAAWGPDSFLRCAGCGYQAEPGAARFRRQPAAGEPRPSRKVATPGCTTIEELAGFLGIERAQTAKAVFMMASPRGAAGPGSAGRAETFVMAIVRGDREVSERKLAGLLRTARLRPAVEAEIRAVGAVPGYASPVGLAPGTTVIVDEEAALSANLAAGANEEGFHLLDTNIPRDYRPTRICDIAQAGPGDVCPECGAPLEPGRGVTLATLRSPGAGAAAGAAAAGPSFLDRDGKARPLFIGTFEMALDRVLACAAAAHRDERGLVWPGALAPFDVHLVSLGAPGTAAGDAAERCERELASAGVEMLFDDRSESPGVKFADADLIGIPVRITASTKSLEAGGLELKLRDRQEREIVAESALVSRVRELRAR